MKKEGAKKFSWSTFWKVFFVLITFGVIALIGLTDKSGGNIFEALGSMDMGFVALAVACIVVFWLMDGVILNYTGRVMFKKEHFGQSFRVGLIGQLYGALTPSATGGQPVQMIIMKRNGYPFGVSSSLLVVKFIAFQSGVCIMFILAALLQPDVFLSSLGAQLALMVVGFVINFAVLLVAVLAMYKNAWLKKVVNGLLRFLHRIHLIKNLEKVQASAMNGLEEYYKSMGAIKQLRRRIWIVLAITLVQLTAYQSVVYFLYRSVGLSVMDYPSMLAMQVLLFTMVGYTPLPGASLASEAGFMWMYSDIMGSMAFPIMLVWRAITFYAQIVIGAIALLWDNISDSRRKHRLAAQGANLDAALSKAENQKVQEENLSEQK